jgi:hypothetical protein
MASKAPYDLQAKFRALSKSLRASYEALDAGGKHGGEKGLRRETVLCEFLAKHLPPAYGVARGEVVSAEGWTSKQVDVVIYDAFHSPLLEESEGSKVFPAECVYAAIELKARLDATSLLEALATVGSAKGLARNALVEQHHGHRLYSEPRENPPIFGVLFAMESSATPQHLVTELVKQHRKLVPQGWLDCVCIMDKALIYQFARHPKVFGADQWTPTMLDEKAYLGYYDSKEDTLFLFYLFLLYQLNARDLFPPDLLAYARHARMPPAQVFSRRPYDR